MSKEVAVRRTWNSKQCWGCVEFEDRIAHHYTSGLSTVEVAYNNVARLNQEFQVRVKQKEICPLCTQ